MHDSNFAHLSSAVCESFGSFGLGRALSVIRQHKRPYANFHNTFRSFDGHELGCILPYRVLSSFSTTGSDPDDLQIDQIDRDPA